MKRKPIEIDAFVSKISKMGKQRLINVPAVLHKYFPVGAEVEVHKIGKINKRGKEK